MSGPPYPHPSPAPGSNAIGSFVIGVSPIGDITPFDVWTTMLSQYANSPTLSGLCVNMSQYVDENANFQQFFDTIWNIDTASDLGLDIWGRIIGVSRTLQVAIGRYFGFGEQGGATVGTFGESTFYSGNSLTNNFQLSNPAYRVLLFAKALSNICDGSIKATNQILLNLFPNRGNAFVIDNEDMTMTYAFSFFLTPVEVAIVTQSGALPRPSGVLVGIQQGV